MRGPMLLVAILTLVIAGVVTAPAGAQSAADFHRCADAPEQARCGHVIVPLDRRGGQPSGDTRTLRIEFEHYPRRRSELPSLGTMVDVEGGPGFSTTDSRDYYLELHDRLMDRRALLLVDQRGTGHSGALFCRAFRRSVADYVRRAGACARQLGSRVDLYGTHAAVEDLADVLDALAIDRIDLYGDSYGSYFAQAFAVRRGERLRSLVLDATYPLPGTDPAFGDLPRRAGAHCGSCARGGRAARRAERIRSPCSSGSWNGSA